MKKLNFKSAILLGIVVAFFSCDTIQQDPIDPRLIKYTETGERTAAALINGKVWKSELQKGLFGSWRNDLCVSNFPTKDSLILAFVSNSSSMLFSIKGWGIQNLEDFERFKNKKIQLDGAINAGAVVELDPYSISHFSEHPTGIGQIYFKNIRFVGDSLIISGGFGFREEKNDTVVSYGRFDYILSKTMFKEAANHESQFTNN